MHPLDITVMIALAASAWRGYRKGFILMICSMLAFVFALIACLKLNYQVSLWIRPLFESSKYVTFTSYLIVFGGVYFLVFRLGKFAESLLKMAKLGTVDRIAGAAFSGLQTAFFISGLIWLSDQIHLFGLGTRQGAISYDALRGFAPYVIRLLQPYYPFMKGLTQDIEHFFDHFKSSTPAA